MTRIQKGFASPDTRRANILYMRDEALKGCTRAVKGADSMLSHAMGWADATRKGLDDAILARDMRHTARMRTAYRDVSAALGAAKAAELAVKFANETAATASTSLDLAYNSPTTTTTTTSKRSNTDTDKPQTK